MDENKIVFKSGNELYPHLNIVGIDNEGNLFEGYDGEVNNLEIKDRIELSEIMIKRWKDYRRKELLKQFNPTIMQSVDITS